LTSAASGVLAQSIGVAASPVPIVGVTVALMSPRGRPNGVAFLGGWITGIALVAIGTFLAAGNLDLSSGSTASRAIGGAQIGVGVLLFAEGTRRWVDLLRRGARGELWSDTFHRLTPTTAIAFGFALAALNPKNFGLAAGAAVDVARADLHPFASAAWLVGFVAIACATVATPVAYATVRDRSARRVLERWRDWLSRHGETLLVGVLWIVGLVFVAQGVCSFG
jgi:uncharacterized membrane protein YidH (DUF202 family)